MDEDHDQPDNDDPLPQMTPKQSREDPNPLLRREGAAVLREAAVRVQQAAHRLLAQGEFLEVQERVADPAVKLESCQPPLVLGVVRNGKIRFGDAVEGIGRYPVARDGVRHHLPDLVARGLLGLALHGLGRRRRVLEQAGQVEAPGDEASNWSGWPRR